MIAKRKVVWLREIRSCMYAALYAVCCTQFVVVRNHAYAHIRRMPILARMGNNYIVPYATIITLFHMRRNYIVPYAMMIILSIRAQTIPCACRLSHLCTGQYTYEVARTETTGTLLFTTYNLLLKP